MGMRVSSRRGQSMGEYAILFAIVLGAAIAMQQYVKARLQGAIQFRTDEYERSAGGSGTFEDPNRVSDSESKTALDMGSATAGTVAIDSSSETTSTK